MTLFRCLKAETRKLWGRPGAGSAFIFLALFMCACVALCLFCQSSGAAPRILTVSELGESALFQYDYDNWQEQCEETVSGADAKRVLLGLEAGNSSGLKKTLIEKEEQKLEREVAIAEYRLYNNISPENENSWRILAFCLWLCAPAVSLAAAFAAADVFAGEYERGTMRMSFCRPATRIKQYTAKLFSLSLYSALLCVAVWFAGLLCCGVAAGNDTSAVYLYYNGGELGVMSMFSYTLRTMLFCAAAPAFCIAVCALVGNASHSKAATVSCAMSLMIVSYYFGFLLSSLGGTVLGLSIFGCLDLSAAGVGALSDSEPSLAARGASVAAHCLLLCIAGYFPMRRDLE